MDKVRYYLDTVLQQKSLPNFWMSEEYIEHAGLVWCEEGLLEGFKLTEDENEWFFPPIDKSKKLPFHSNHNIYAGFPLSFSNVDNSTLLDYQFFYKPSNFQKMTGKKWKVFRKNVRKFPARCMGKPRYQPILPGEHLDSLESLIVDWTQMKGSSLFDGEVLLNFALFGKNRMGLFYGNQLLGINIWDENPEFINFRYCMDIGENFLNEYLRLLFYLDGTILNRKKLVNDGGALDSDNLFRFKEKLNPIQILRVYQYKEITNEAKTRPVT